VQRGHRGGNAFASLLFMICETVSFMYNLGLRFAVLDKFSQNILDAAILFALASSERIGRLYSVSSDDQQ